MEIELYRKMVTTKLAKPHNLSIQIIQTIMRVMVLVKELNLVRFVVLLLIFNVSIIVQTFSLMIMNQNQVVIFLVIVI